MKKYQKHLFGSFGLLIAFIVWTLAVSRIDVRAIGPNGSKVGFSSINWIVHGLTGVHFLLYSITEWLGLVPFAVCLGFAFLGLKQWIQRKSLKQVEML